jgi:hypothetical protein
MMARQSWMACIPQLQPAHKAKHILHIIRIEHIARTIAFSQNSYPTRQVAYRPWMTAGTKQKKCRGRPHNIGAHPPKGCRVDVRGGTVQPSDSWCNTSNISCPSTWRSILLQGMVGNAYIGYVCHCSCSYGAQPVR